MKKPLNRGIIFALLSVSWMAAIFWQSSKTGLPGNEFTAVIGHLAEYAVLAYLYYRTIARSDRGFQTHAALAAILLAVTYGVSDEWHQSWVPTRQADIWDVATDMVGALAMMGSMRLRRST